MQELGTEIVPHEQFREVVCCLCGRVWAQHFVAVTLVVGDRPLGDLCPRCLHCTPVQVAGPLVAAASRLSALYDELEQCSPGASPNGPDEFRQALVRFLEASRSIRAIARLAREWSAEVRVRSGRTRELSERLLENARRTRDEATALQPVESRPRDRPLPYSGVVHDAEPVRHFARALAELWQWPTTVDQVIDAEMAHFLNRYPGLSREEVRVAVEERYREYLAVPS
jgi:hypothetical protein